MNNSGKKHCRQTIHRLMIDELHWVTVGEWVPGSQHL